MTIGKLIFVILHGALLLPLVLNESDNLFLLTIVPVLFTLLIIGNWQAERQSANHSSFTPIWIVLGGVVTYFLGVEMNLGPVIAASLVGLTASFIPSFISSAKQLPGAIYCGSFVGMCSPMIAPNYTFIVLASLFAGGIFLLVKDDLNGMGGKLGTIAFSGVILLTLLIHWMK